MSDSHASCTLGVREECRSRAAEARPATAPDEHRGVRQNAIDGPIAGGVVDSGKAGAGEGKLTLTKHLFLSLCFPPSVSLYGFLPLSATGRRPAFGCFLGFPPGLLEEGGPPLRAGPPSSTVQVNLDGPAQAGSWSGVRRSGGRGDRGQGGSDRQG